MKTQQLETYCNIKPSGRLQELELFAFTLMTGEEVEETLRAYDEELADEYVQLSEGGEE